MAENDTGLAVGPKGSHVNAMRLLLTAACKKLDVKFHLDVLTPGGQRRNGRR